MKHFAEGLVYAPEPTGDVHQTNQGHGSEAVSGGVTRTMPKLFMEEFNLPDKLLDIDDQLCQDISENSQFLYPDDNSVMKVDHFEIGGKKFSKSVVMKDNFTFGLREARKDQIKLDNEPEEFGLVSLKPVGDTEFWLSFENGTKMLVEQVAMKRNDQRLIKIDPPKPTPEEIAAREEAIKAAQAAAAKKPGNKKDATAPVIEEYKEPEPTWEPQEFNFLDHLFDDQPLEVSKAMTTLTFNNGLIV